ncbi:unnamed protein product [Caenorhabditis nigoni]
MTENLSMDPVYETNWNDMPEEIKLECIEKMELNERLSLRCTAKAERSLVDSQKMKIASGGFQITHIGLNFFLRPQIFKILGNPTEAVELTNYVFKIGVFGGIFVHYRDDDVMHFTEEISAKYIHIVSCKNKTVVDVLQKLKKGVEDIRIKAKRGHEYALDDILANDHVRMFPTGTSKTAIKRIAFKKSHRCGSMKTQKSEPPSKEEGGGSFEFQKIFLEHFTDHIVSNTGKRIRIRTNNPDRHILLERGLDYDDDGDDEMEESYEQFYRLMVISAEMDESEYDDRCNKWISIIDVENHYANDDEPNANINENHENIQNDDQVENRERNPDDEDDDDW